MRPSNSWDFEDVDGGHDAVIRLKSQDVWREPALWEGSDRFLEVKALLKERYGSRFRSLTPTEGSELYLYGDNVQLVISGGMPVD